MLAQAHALHAQTSGKVRLVSQTPYQSSSWGRERRVVYKAEALAKGPNTRFVVTTRPDPPEALYDFYVDRGTPELWIKDLKCACSADRLSDCRVWANQFRLLLYRYSVDSGRSGSRAVHKRPETAVLPAVRRAVMAVNIDGTRARPPSACRGAAASPASALMTVDVRPWASVTFAGR